MNPVKTSSSAVVTNTAIDKRSMAFRIDLAGGQAKSFG